MTNLFRDFRAALAAERRWYLDAFRAAEQEFISLGSTSNALIEVRERIEALEKELGE
jgi:hypothetical protein